jgi:hypothetical protein
LVLNTILLSSCEVLSSHLLLPKKFLGSSFVFRLLSLGLGLGRRFLPLELLRMPMLLDLC